MNKIEKDIRLEMDKMTLESKENYLKKLIATLVEFGFKDVCTQALGFDELWRSEVRSNTELLNSSNLPENQKAELHRSIFPIFYSKEQIEEREKSGLSDEHWQVKENIKYCEKRIKIAEDMLEKLPDDVKTKVVEECITKRSFWYDSIAAYGKIKKAIEEQKPKKKCSACKDSATKELLIYSAKDQKRKWIPRCDKHIVKGFKGKIRNIGEK